MKIRKQDLILITKKGRIHVGWRVRTACWEKGAKSEIRRCLNENMAHLKTVCIAAQVMILTWLEHAL